MTRKIRCDGFTLARDGRVLRAPGCSQTGTYGPIRGKHYCYACWQSQQAQDAQKKDATIPYARTG